MPSYSLGKSPEQIPHWAVFTLGSRDRSLTCTAEGGCATRLWSLIGYWPLIGYWSASAKQQQSRSLAFAKNRSDKRIRVRMGCGSGWRASSETRADDADLTGES